MRTGLLILCSLYNKVDLLMMLLLISESNASAMMTDIRKVSTPMMMPTANIRITAPTARDMKARGKREAKWSASPLEDNQSSIPALKRAEYFVYFGLSGRLVVVSL
ncbi:MAG TPA: hypothetical protein VF088_13200 [Pyrinomonadaceae bacterium]